MNSSIGLSRQQKEENQWENHSQCGEPPSPAAETVFAFFNEHAGHGHGKHGEAKNVGIVDPPLTGILMKLRHLTQEGRYHIRFDFTSTCRQVDEGIGTGV